MAGISGHVFPRKMGEDIPIADRGEGVWVIDQNGKRYLDASGGAVVVNLGHGQKEIAEAVYAQLMKGYYFHPTMFTTQPVEDLGAALAKHTPEGISRFYFLSGGAEAVETAIKLARQVHLAKGEPQRIRLIARRKSYHGLTMGALAAMGRTPFRKAFTPMLAEVEHIPAPYCLRCSFGLEYPACDLRCARYLEETIQHLGPEVVSAFLGETVSGATIAAVPPPPGYWPLIREICDRYGVLLIHDEVMVGMGRTGKWFASQHYGTAPDIMTMGKGISGGAMALSAVGMREDHYQEVIAAGGFAHGGTYTHHPVAAAAGLKAIEILERDRLVERAAEMGDVLGNMLRERLADHPHVAEIRGLGMIWGVEIVKDRDGIKPYPRGEKVTERLAAELFDQGVLVYKSMGLAGIDGDGLVLAPPYIIEKEHLEFLVGKMDEALAKVLGD